MCTRQCTDEDAEGSRSRVRLKGMVVPGEWQAMKTALEKRLGCSAGWQALSGEGVLAKVEAGKYRAEALTDATIVQEPQIAKSLRRRLILVRNCWMMIAVKHTRRPELEGDYLDVVEQYKDYILGTDCMPRTLLQRFIWTLLQRPGHFYSALGDCGVRERAMTLASMLQFSYVLKSRILAILSPWYMFSKKFEILGHILESRSYSGNKLRRCCKLTLPAQVAIDVHSQALHGCNVSR